MIVNTVNTVSIARPGKSIKKYELCKTCPIRLAKARIGKRAFEDI